MVQKVQTFGMYAGNNKFYVLFLKILNYHLKLKVVTLKNGTN